MALESSGCDNTTLGTDLDFAALLLKYSGFTIIENLTDHADGEIAIKIYIFRAEEFFE